MRRPCGWVTRWKYCWEFRAGRRSGTPREESERADHHGLFYQRRPPRAKKGKRGRKKAKKKDEMCDYSTRSAKGRLPWDGQTASCLHFGRRGSGNQAFLEKDSFFLCRPSEMGRSGLPEPTYDTNHTYLFPFLSINSTYYLPTLRLGPTYTRAGASTFGVGALPPFCDNYAVFRISPMEEATATRVCLEGMRENDGGRPNGERAPPSALRIAIYYCVNDLLCTIIRRTAPHRTAPFSVRQDLSTFQPSVRPSVCLERHGRRALRGIITY